MFKSGDGISVYKTDDGYVVRFKRRDGRRLTVKLPAKEEEAATREAIQLLTEAICNLRARINFE